MTLERMISNLLKYKEEEDSFLDETNFGQSQSDIIIASVNELVRQKVVQICSIWVQIGVPRSRRVERVEEIRQQVEEDLLNSLTLFIEHEQNTLNTLRQYKTDKLKEVNEYLSDLHMPLYELEEGISLTTVAKRLHIKHSELHKLKSERMEKWNELIASKTHLCTKLGMEEKPFKSATGIPSEPELMQLQSIVLDLNQVGNRRVQHLNSAKITLSELYTELETEATTDFEKSMQDEKFVLSETNLAQVDKLIKSYKTQQESNRLQREKMLDRLASLWDKLSIDKEEQLLVKSYAQNWRPSTLKMLQTEIDRLEELKRQNLSVFISKIRPEIEQWWEKCCTSEEDIAEFCELYFAVDESEATEQLLEAHEAELERLKTMYKENEEIFVKCAKWRSYWIRLRELEVKSKDPNRFNNRGGALLQEEKERKQLQKGIPKLENELKQLAKAWSNSHNEQVFTIYGRSIERYFTDYWSMYNQAKENEKEKKKNIKKAEMEAEFRGIRSTNSTMRRTPMKRGNTPAVNSPATAEKQLKLDTFSSIKRPAQITENEIVNRCTTRKAFAKNLKQDFDKMSVKPSLIGGSKQVPLPQQKPEFTNFENSIVNESQFQSTRIEDKQKVQPVVIEKMFNRFGFREESPIITPTISRCDKASRIASGQNTPLQENKLILNSPAQKKETIQISLPKNRKPFYVN